jgi:polyhydroxybutyrate depolymerase
MTGPRGWRQPPPELERRTIEVDGVDRTYWVAPAPRCAAPLLVVLHGMGLTGPSMAAWTGLAVRGPASGFATVFPDARGQMWDDRGLGRSDGIDDAAFVTALVDRLVAEGVAREGRLVLVGLSNGAFFAERLARHGLVPATGIVLVAGTAREASRRVRPRPERPAAVLCFEGTADPLVPYRGGTGTGPLAWMARRHTQRVLATSDGREAVAAEVVAADWAAVNGCSADPSVEPVPGAPGDLPVDRLTWTAPGCRPVVLYRIRGGGHAWPAGPQYMPARLVGPVARHLDATGILLAMARDETGTEDLDPPDLDAACR